MSIIEAPVPVDGPRAPDGTSGPLERQPTIGLVGGAVALGLFLILGVIISPPSSLQILGAVTTFSLPVLIASALWWQGWPVRGLSRPIAGLVNTALIIGLAVVLTALAQVIVGRADLSHLLSVTPAGHGPERPPFTSYPWTLPLAALIFLTMILLTFVSERWPLRALGTAGAGAAALAVAWIVGLVAYLLLANWNSIVPPPVQGALGLGNPGGPANAFDLLGWTLCVAVWAVVVFIPLRGTPLAAIRSTAARVLVGNVAVIALGWLTFLALEHALSLTVPEIAAACGVTIAASIIVALVFEAWPARMVTSDGGRIIALLGTIAVLAAVLFIVLKAIGDARGTWTAANPVYLWMTVCALNFLAAGSILWYGVWGRWPAAPVSRPHAGDGRS